MSADEVNPRRRRLLTFVTTGIGAVGALFAATPFVKSMKPSARAKAAGAPVEVDISNLQPGRVRTEEWRGKPVWILKRTPEMLASLKAVQDKLVDPNSEVDTQQPSYAQNETRSIKPDVLVLVGLCTHLGCSPDKVVQAGPDARAGEDWQGGFFCPCHGSKFDLAGRVYKNVPAPKNLEVPSHTYLSDTRILIGVDPSDKGAA